MIAPNHSSSSLASPPASLGRAIQAAAALWVLGSFIAACVAAGYHQSSSLASLGLVGTPSPLPAQLSRPENLVYDPAAGVLLVSNVDGVDTAHDDNGYISRLRPDGSVLDAHWISGGVHGVRLDAPKGLAIHGDTLAVADLGAVYLFDRRTGAPLRTIALPGRVLNDLTYAADGTLWITDTGPSVHGASTDDLRDVDAVSRETPDGHVTRVRTDGLVGGSSS
jgi:sugar lactone lactonase YvrE